MTCEYCNEAEATVFVKDGKIWAFCKPCARRAKAFIKLHAFLKQNFLPGDPKSRVAHPGEFMHMGVQENTMGFQKCVGFKHSVSRRYLFMNEETGEVHIPADFTLID